MLLGLGVIEHRTGLAEGAAIGFGVSTAATWFLPTMSARVQRRFRDKVTLALESHVAQLQASVATIAHQERPEYLDRLFMLRHQVFMLDHMYVSVFSTPGADPTAGRDPCPAGVDSPGAHPADGFRGPDRADVDVAARGGEIGAGARGASQLAVAPPVHHRRHRAGKTTLVKLLAKMHEPTSGSSLVDDTPLARVPAGDWRRRCRPPGFRPRHATRSDVAGRSRAIVRPVAKARSGAWLHARSAAAPGPG